MSKYPFYNTAERIDQLWSIAKSWEGTPYRDNAASKGFAVGCVNLILEINVETGAVKRFKAPRYETDRGYHRADNLLIKFLLKEPTLQGRLIFVPRGEEIAPGDVIGLQIGHSDHHICQAMKWGKFIHTMRGVGTSFEDLDDPRFARRVLYVLRLLEVPAT